jgi:hypothetical protein
MKTGTAGGVSLPTVPKGTFLFEITWGHFQWWGTLPSNAGCHATAFWAGMAGTSTTAFDFSLTARAERVLGYAGLW